MQAKSIIGVTGLAGSGKDTTCDMLVDAGFVKVSFADPLKRLAMSLYAFSEEQLWGPSHMRNEPDPRYPLGDGQYLTPRRVLQIIGTEGVRAAYQPTWVMIAMRTAHQILEGYSYSRTMGIGPVALDRPRGVCFPDTRFVNEMEAIRGVGGQLVRVTRDGSGLTGAAALHDSEREHASLPDSSFDHVIRNNGTFDELRARVELILPCTFS